MDKLERKGKVRWLFWSPQPCFRFDWILSPRCSTLSMSSLTPSTTTERSSPRNSLLSNSMIMWWAGPSRRLSTTPARRISWNPRPSGANNILIAFRCLLLEQLPVSRIVPLSELVPDDDPSMNLVNEHLSATERDIRSGDAERNSRQSFGGPLVRLNPSPSLAPTVRPLSPQSSLRSRNPTGQRPPMNPTNRHLPPVSLHLRSDRVATGAILALGTVWSQSVVKILQPRTSLRNWQIKRLQPYSGFQDLGFPDDTKRLRFRCLDLLVMLTCPAGSHLCLPLFFMGKLSSYNYGSFFLERRSRVDHMNGWFRILILGLLWKYFPIILPPLFHAHDVC